jgi:hypothetical protein
VIVYAAGGREVARLPAAAEYLALFARAGPAGTRPGMMVAVAGDAVTALYLACDFGFPPEALLPAGAQPLPAR